jgi:hypothetical protein
MVLDMLLFTLLPLATVVIWWRVWDTRPTRRLRHPGWGTRLERRLTGRQQQWCVLCGKVGHTMQEHVRVPHSELEGMAEPDVFLLPRVWHPSVHNVTDAAGKPLPTKGVQDLFWA